MLRLAIGILIFAMTMGLVMVRPYRLPGELAAAGGAALMLLCGYVRPGEALHVLGGEWNIYGFFLGLMIISALADQAGVFESIAYRAVIWAGGSALRLYLAVFAVGALITSFLSNDATALILTPIVFTIVTRLRLPVLPFIFACTFIADSASFLLPVSNPVNILVIDEFGRGLVPFLHMLLLPSLFCIFLNTALFTWLFHKDLRHSYNLKDLPPLQLENRGFYAYTLRILALIAFAYIAASSFQLPLSLVALSGAGLLLAGAFHYRCLDLGNLRHEISWSLFVFISGMFVVIRAVQNLGLTASFGNALVHLSSSNPIMAILLIAGGSALGANLLNNLPMALVMISTLSSTASHASQVGLIYATILGVDLGPNLTIVGSLATILWMLILRRKGLEISSLEYIKLGMTIVPLMILVGSVLIWLRL